MIRLRAALLALALCAVWVPAQAAGPAKGGLSAPADSPDATRHAHRAYELFSEDDYEGAVAEYDRALEIDPDHLLALTGRALVRAVQGKDLDRAMADCARAERVNPQHPSVYFSRALIHYRRSEFEAAIADLNHVLDLYPAMYSAVFVRGMAEDELGRKTEAQRDYAAARAQSDTVADQFMRWRFLGFKADGSAPKD